MGKDKLRKFRENEQMQNVVEPATEEVRFGLGLKGNWAQEQFGNDHGIVLELGCGKGEYTVEHGRRHPERNHIGVDIKGARLWRGAKTAVAGCASLLLSSSEKFSAYIFVCEMSSCRGVYYTCNSLARLNCRRLKC